MQLYLGKIVFPCSGFQTGLYEAMSDQNPLTMKKAPASENGYLHARTQLAYRQPVVEDQTVIGRWFEVTKGVTGTVGKFVFVRENRISELFC